MAIKPTPPTREKLFGLRVSGPEHALMHAAARAEGYDSSSAWARGVLLSAARESFRGALREAAGLDGEPSESREPERAKVQA